MRVVFINDDFSQIVALPDIYSEKEGYQQAILDFKSNQCQPNISTGHFLKHYDNWNVYKKFSRSKDLHLTYLGKILELVEEWEF